MHCCMRTPVSKHNRDSVGPSVMIYRPGTGRSSFRMGSVSYALDSDWVQNLQNCNVDEAQKYLLFRSARISECPNIIRHCQLTAYLLTYSMEQSPSWEANRFAACQEIPRILWNPKVHYRIHKCFYSEPDQSSPCPHHIALLQDPL
jgi:hypothetical protein